MGLDFRIGTTQYSNAHWSYSGFHRFRTRIAESIGIKLEVMEGYAGLRGMPWNMINNPLKYLLNHSDCDGTIGYKTLEKVMPALQEVVGTWPHEDYDRNTGLELIDAMKKCIKIKKSLYFV